MIMLHIYQTTPSIIFIHACLFLGGAFGDEGTITRIGQGKHWSAGPGGQHDMGAATSAGH